jgi:hypothetical protein
MNPTLQSRHTHAHACPCITCRMRTHVLHTTVRAQDLEQTSAFPTLALAPQFAGITALDISHGSYRDRAGDPHNNATVMRMGWSVRRPPQPHRRKTPTHLHSPGQSRWSGVHGSYAAKTHWKEKPTQTLPRTFHRHHHHPN